MTEFEAQTRARLAVLEQFMVAIVAEASQLAVEEAPPRFIAGVIAVAQARLGPMVHEPMQGRRRGLEIAKHLRTAFGEIADPLAAFAASQIPPEGQG